MLETDFNLIAKFFCNGMDFMYIKKYFFAGTV